MSVPINIEIIGFSSLKNDCLVLAPLFFLIMSGAFFVLHKKKKKNLLMVMEIETKLTHFRK